MVILVMPVTFSVEKLTDILTSENEGVLFSQKEPGKI